MSVKDDFFEDFPHLYPGLTRSEIVWLLTLLDESASREGDLSLSIATALKPSAPDLAGRIQSYKRSSDVDEYVRMLRSAAVLLLQQWHPQNEPPSPDSISNMIGAIES